MAYIGNSDPSGFSAAIKDRFSGDNSTTGFTLSRATASVNDLQIFVDNVRQEPTIAYTVSGSTLTFTEAPPTGTNNVYVVHTSSVGPTILPPQDLGTTDYIFGGAIAVGQSSFTGGNVLADFHTSGSGVGTQLSFANDHNTDTFQLGLAGNTSGDVIFYNNANTDMDFYTNNALRFSITNSEVVVNDSSADVDFRVEGNGDANLLFVDAGNDKVGVGTNSPSGIFDVTSSANVEPTVNITGDGTGYTHGAIALKSSTGNDARVRGQGIYLFNEENDTTWYVGTSYQNTSAGSRPFDFNFKTSTTSLSTVTAHTDNTKLRIQADGTISAPSGIELGSGLDNTDANTLDDYEEGTFVVAFSSGSGTVTIDDSFKTGVYTKIGSVVTFTIHARVASVSGNSGSLLITGMPFTTPNDNKYRHTIGVMAFFTLTGMTNLELPFAYLSSNTTTLNLAITNTNNLQALNSNRVQASSEFYITGSYQVTV